MAFNRRVLRSTDVGIEDTFLSFSIMNEDTGEMYGFRCPFPETVHISLLSLNDSDPLTQGLVTGFPPAMRTADGLPVYNFMQVGGETRFIWTVRMTAALTQRFAETYSPTMIAMNNDDVFANENDERRRRFFAHFTSPDLGSILQHEVRVMISPTLIFMVIDDVYNVDYILRFRLLP